MAIVKSYPAKGMDLVYSPDDGGYYWSEYGSWKVSQLFKTQAEAEKAVANSSLEWSE